MIQELRCSNHSVNITMTRAQDNLQLTANQTYITPHHECAYLIVHRLQFCLLNCIKAHCKGKELQLWCSIWYSIQHLTSDMCTMICPSHGPLCVSMPGMNTVVANCPSWCGNCLMPCRLLPGNVSAEVGPPSTAPCRTRFAGLNQQLCNNVLHCTMLQMSHASSS
jgi:hypothetical protein